MTVSERKHLAEATVEFVHGRVPVAIHVGAIRTEDARDLAAHAQHAGADAVAAVPPFYYPYADAELVAYFVAIAEGAPGLPLYLYNLPTYCRNVLTPSLIQELLERVPNIVGMKESSASQPHLREFLAVAGPSFEVICGADHLIGFALAHGAVGSVSSGAAVFPELYRDLADASLNDPDQAEAHQQRIIAMQAALSGGARIARYKACWGLRGLDLGSVRPPLTDVTSEEVSELKRALADLGLLKLAV